MPSECDGCGKELLAVYVALICEGEHPFVRYFCGPRCLRRDIHGIANAIDEIRNLDTEE